MRYQVLFEYLLPPSNPLRPSDFVVKVSGIWTQGSVLAPQRTERVLVTRWFDNPPSP